MMHARRPTGFVCLEAAARLLKKRHVCTGPHLIFKQLRDLGWLEGHYANWKFKQAGLISESNGLLENGNGYTRQWLSRQALDQLEKLLPVIQEIKETRLGIQPGKFGF